jgi:hypothetical protein
MPLAGITDANEDLSAQREVTVFKKKCNGTDEVFWTICISIHLPLTWKGNEMAEWFSQFMGFECRLVRYYSGRDINPTYE